jgi:hypothetical protein
MTVDTVAVELIKKLESDCKKNNVIHMKLIRQVSDLVVNKAT